MYPQPHSMSSSSVIGSNAPSVQLIFPRYEPASVRLPEEGCSIGTILAIGLVPRMTMTSFPASASLSRREK